MISSSAPGRWDTIQLVKAVESRNQRQRRASAKWVCSNKMRKFTSGPNSIAATTHPIENRPDIEPQAAKRHRSYPTITDDLKNVIDKNVCFLGLSLELVTWSF